MDTELWYDELLEQEDEPIDNEQSGQVEIDLFEDNRTTIGKDGSVIQVVEPPQKRVKIEKRVEVKPTEITIEELDRRPCRSEYTSYDSEGAMTRIFKILLLLVATIVFCSLVVNIIIPATTTGIICKIEDSMYAATGMKLDINGDGYTGGTDTKELSVHNGGK